MLKITEKTKVFVPCPAGACTGGAELLHQLVDLLNNNNVDAYIVYYGAGKHSLPSDYRKYNIKFADLIDDAEDNVAVIHEGCFEQALHINKAQIILWWLSVDYYFICNNHSALEMIRYQLVYPEKYSTRKLLKGILRSFIKPYDTISLGKMRGKNIAVNAYQSEYAKAFLAKHSYENLHPLKDYINDDNFAYVLDTSGRDNIVIYNPKKGYEFTQKLIAYDASIKWVPIINMSRSEVLDLMRKAKVYSDFGFHPGKDRLPREAATNGCCIITGIHGSANYLDIDIPTKYKHTQTNEDIPVILKQIHDLLDNYESRISDYEHYRSNIRKEKQEFVEDAKDIFQIR